MFCKNGFLLTYSPSVGGEKHGGCFHQHQKGLLCRSSFSLFQWNQECLAYLLRLITQFSVERQDVENSQEEANDVHDSPRKKIRKIRGMQEKIIIPRLTRVSASTQNCLLDHISEVDPQRKFGMYIKCPVNNSHK